MSPARCSRIAVSVTPSRRTPSMLAISSWVMFRRGPVMRSRLISSQRHNCWSRLWWRLHTAVCAICVISAWGVAQQQVHHRHRAVEFGLDEGRRQPQALPGALHHGPVGCGVAAHEQRYANPALPCPPRQFRPRRRFRSRTAATRWRWWAGTHGSSACPASYSTLPSGRSMGSNSGSQRAASSGDKAWTRLCSGKGHGPAATSGSRRTDFANQKQALPAGRPKIVEIWGGEINFA